MNIIWNILISTEKDASSAMWITMKTKNRRLNFICEIWYYYSEDYECANYNCESYIYLYLIMIIASNF